MTAEHSLAEQYVERVEAQVDELVRIIVAASDERWCRRPSQDAWTGAEVCGHVIEMLPFWAAQAQEIAANPGMRYGRDEQDPRRISGIAGGAALGRHDAVEGLRAAVATTCRTLRTLPDSAWTAEGVSATGGRETVGAMIERALARHLEAHVEQVREAVS